MTQTFWGAALMMKGDSSEAVEVLKEAQAVGMWNNMTLGLNKHYLINALIASGQAAEAQALLAATPASGQPSFALSRAVMMGVTQALLNRPDAARVHFKGALEIANQLINRPGRFEVFYRRGIANAGLALLDQDEARLTAALADITAARSECAAPGVVRWQAQLLDALMACPGGAGRQLSHASLISPLLSNPQGAGPPLFPCFLLKRFLDDAIGSHRYCGPTAKGSSGCQYVCHYSFD